MEGNSNITYQKVYWLFLAGSLIGLVLEGLWCLVRQGHWESHVNFIWEPLCGIYGVGVVGCYVGAVFLRTHSLIRKFIAFGFIGTVVELAAGLMLEYGLHMRAWDYSGTFMNVKGHINLKMTVLWGILGCVFSFLLPVMERVLGKMQGGGWRIACAGLSVLLAVDIIATSMCLIRWSNRHAGIPAGNGLERMIDRIYSDEVMEKRFCEWHFILMGSEPGRHADKEEVSPLELGYLAAAQRMEAPQGAEILMDDRND